MLGDTSLSEEVQHLLYLVSPNKHRPGGSSRQQSMSGIHQIASKIKFSGSYIVIYTVLEIAHCISIAQEFEVSKAIWWYNIMLHARFHRQSPEIQILGASILPVIIDVCFDKVLNLVRSSSDSTELVRYSLRRSYQPHSASRNCNQETLLCRCQFDHQ